MGGVKKFLKKSANFTKNVYGGGYVRDMIKNPKKGLGNAINEGADVFGVKMGGGDGGLQGISDTLNEATAEQQRLHALQTQAGLKGLNAIKPAYAAARANVQVGKSNAMQGAADRGTQAQASAQQSLASRGLYNSTVYDNATRGISSQVTRDLADIEQSYAQLLAQLDIGEGQATTQAQQFMSGTYGQQAQGVTDLKLGQAQIQASLYEDPDQWLNDLLGMGTTLGAAYLTGGASLFAGGLGGGSGGGGGGLNVGFNHPHK